MSFSYEEYGDTHFLYWVCNGNIDYDILDDDSLADVCSLVFTNICEKVVPFQV